MPTPAEVIDFLRTGGHLSPNRPVTSSALADHFEIHDGGVQVAMRAIIRDAIGIGELIGSNSRGYYLIPTREVLDMNLHSLQHRASTILERRRFLLDSWNTLNPEDRTDLPDMTVRDTP